ncbi:DUF3237 domain-containing protein [Ruminiclostridium cellobioparum]|uniref:DUF3237 domain-containing protein n=1 Tax=Ruminiclostridium cellobioparum TaxID=29355 RepID=UPI0028AC9C0B|nr:DUF3237 domain-containing protein [Ruminiclostridium cellobioparum]
MQLEADLVMELTVEIGAVLEVGKTLKGYLRLIPIIGGTFSGKGIKGIVIPGGYDWNTAIDENISHVLAKYTLKTEDGQYISIENEGYIDAKAENSVVRTTPRFQVAQGKYEWLCSGVFVASLQVEQTGTPSVKINVYKMK